MKKLVAIFALGALVMSCGEKKEEKKEGFEMNRTKKEEKRSSTRRCSCRHE